MGFRLSNRERGGGGENKERERGRERELHSNLSSSPPEGSTDNAVSGTVAIKPSFQEPVGGGHGGGGCGGRGVGAVGVGVVRGGMLLFALYFVMKHFQRVATDSTGLFDEDEILIITVKTITFMLKN